MAIIKQKLSELYKIPVECIGCRNCDNSQIKIEYSLYYCIYWSNLNYFDNFCELFVPKDVNDATCIQPV